MTIDRVYVCTVCNILGVGEGVLVLGQHARVDVHQAHLVLAEQLLTTQITDQHFFASVSVQSSCLKHRVSLNRGVVAN